MRDFEQTWTDFDPPQRYTHGACADQILRCGMKPGEYHTVTVQELVVRHMKCHGLGPRIANRLATLLYQHLMGLPLLGGMLCQRAGGLYLLLEGQLVW